MTFKVGDEVILHNSEFYVGIETPQKGVVVGFRGDYMNPVVELERYNAKGKNNYCLSFNLKNIRKITKLDKVLK